MIAPYHWLKSMFKLLSTQEFRKIMKLLHSPDSDTRRMGYSLLEDCLEVRVYLKHEQLVNSDLYWSHPIQRDSKHLYKDLPDNIIKNLLKKERILLNEFRSKTNK